MARRIRRALFNVLVVLLLSIIGLEALFRIFDPLGLVYLDDVQFFIGTMTVGNSDGFRLIDGTHQLSHWGFSAHDGFRAVPDAEPSGPTVYFIGDSQTFGWGVEDADTWVSKLSKVLSINGLNYSLPSYNIGNIGPLYEKLPEDACVVWLTINNDMDFGYRWRQVNPRPFSLRLTQLLLRLQARLTPLGETGELATFITHMIDDGVLVVVYESEYGRWAESHGAKLIPAYSQTISFSDGHPTPASHDIIVQGMIPLVREHIAACASRSGT